MNTVSKRLMHSMMRAVPAALIMFYILLEEIMICGKIITMQGGSYEVRIL